jgi:hypothetical protein
MYLSTGLGAVAPAWPGRGPGPAWARPIPVPRMFVVPRRRRRRGMGDETGAQLEAQDLASYEVNLPFQVQQGTYATPDQVAANIQADVNAYCAQWPDRCPGGPPPVSVADYALQLAQAQAQFPTIYTPVPPPPVPPSPPPAVPPSSTTVGAPNPFNPASQPAQWMAFEISQGRMAPGSSPAPRPLGGPTIQPTVQISNVSRPGFGFQVGDSFSLIVTGQAGSAVEATATQNGRALGRTPYGNTDGSGRFTLTGTFDPSTAGVWSEQWFVGGAPAGSLAFTVATPYTAPPASSGSGASGSSAGASGSGSSGGAALPSALTDFLGSSFSLAGYQVPVWAAGAGALALLWMFGGSRR